MEYRIHISHECQRDLGLLPHSFHDVEHTVRGHAVAKGTDIGFLDHYTLCGGIRKRNTDLYEIRSGLLHLQNEFYGAVCIRVSCGEEADECLFIRCIKYFFQFAHRICLHFFYFFYFFYFSISSLLSFLFSSSVCRRPDCTKHFTAPAHKTVISHEYPRRGILQWQLHPCRLCRTDIR